MQETVLILSIFVISNIFCFIIGARVGQKVIKGETVEIPKFEPVKAIKEHREEKAAQAEQEKIDTIMQNIEGYNGSEFGQKEVPKG